MSTIHTSLDTSEPPSLPSARGLLIAIDAVFATVRGSADALRAGLVRRRTMAHVARFSDHGLRDIGFERDWDGTIVPLRR